LLLKKRPGFMTTELMVVAIVLAILAGIASAAVPTFASRAKRAALASTLSVLQGVSDRYFVETNLYPAADQAVAGSKACQVNLAATDVSGHRLVGYYLHNEPNDKAVDYGLATADGTVVYFGVTATGRVFATQAQPVTDAWPTGTVRVYTQENVDGALTLADIW